jgi:hypothetical protein
MSNNAAERAVRCVAVGRHNWTFAGSDAGGRRAAAVYTLIETAKLNDTDPRAWLADVLARLPDHPAKRVGELLPWVGNRATPPPQQPDSIPHPPCSLLRMRAAYYRVSTQKQGRFGHGLGRLYEFPFSIQWPGRFAKSGRIFLEAPSASNVKFRPKSPLKPRPPDGPKYFPSPAYDLHKLPASVDARGLARGRFRRRAD